MKTVQRTISNFTTQTSLIEYELACMLAKGEHGAHEGLIHKTSAERAKTLAIIARNGIIF